MKLAGYSCIADLYDTYVQANFDIPFFINEAKKATEVLELMSGTGRVSLPLIEAGIQLTCVDKSTEMLAVLKNKLAQCGFSAQVVQMDVCELNLPKHFDLVIIPFHSFAEIASQDQQRQALTRIYHHVAPGGRFICTLRNPAINKETPDGTLQLFGKHPLDGQGTLLFWTLGNLDPADNHIIDALEFFEEYDGAGILKSKRLLELRVRLVSKAEFQELAESAGFRIVALYGDYVYSEFREETSPFMLWVLERMEHT